MPLSPYATRPYCLDSEFLPRHLLADGIERLTPEIEVKRAQAAYREFVRSLIFSPQVLIGREAVAGHPVIANAVKDRRERDAMVKLLANDRLNILLMISRGKKGERYQEQTLDDFFDHSRFRMDDEAVGIWRGMVADVGNTQFPYVKLDADQSQAMENRFSGFFKLPPDHSSLQRLFADSLGRQPTDYEQDDLRSFWKEDLRHFTRSLEDAGQDAIYRLTIYNEYIRPDGNSSFLKSLESVKSANLEARRQRLRIPLKLITDLAYNANTPATLGIKSFVPPEMPDPVGLPSHLFQQLPINNPATKLHAAAVEAAYSSLVARRIEAREHFFYETQTFEQLPDIASFTLDDTVMVMDWAEWRAFKYAQQATMNFQEAEELEKLMKDYWDTIRALHNRLEIEARSRSTWRRVTTRSVSLAISVTAHVMGHALLPDVMHAVPWWATVASATAVSQPIHAGLDIIVHGLEHGSQRLLTELGFKDGGLREFTISQEMQQRLRALRESEEQVSVEQRSHDAVIADASGRIAAEG